MVELPINNETLVQKIVLNYSSTKYTNQVEKLEKALAKYQKGLE